MTPFTAWTDKDIARRFQNGFGHGTREAYMPWRYVTEFSSIGTSTRVPSLLFDRAIQTFSYLERNMYQFLEFEGGVLDYREQFPLDRRVTLAAAKRLKVRHPRYEKSRQPIVMNVDALVTREGGQMEIWDAKPKARLAGARVQNKLLLHKAYCDHHGISYHLFTEDSVPKAKLRNIDRIRAALPRTGELLTPIDLFSRHMPIVKQAIVQRYSRKTIEKFCLEYDRAHSLPMGSALRLVWVLLWTKQLLVDLNVNDLALTSLSDIRADAQDGDTVRQLATVSQRELEFTAASIAALSAASISTPAHAPLH